jgi:hypothetical protein
MSYTMKGLQIELENSANDRCANKLNTTIEHLAHIEVHNRRIQIGLGLVLARVQPVLVPVHVLVPLLVQPVSTVHCLDGHTC